MSGRTSLDRARRRRCPEESGARKNRLRSPLTPRLRRRARTVLGGIGCRGECDEVGALCATGCRRRRLAAATSPCGPRQTDQVLLARVAFSETHDGSRARRTTCRDNAARCPHRGSPEAGTSKRKPVRARLLRRRIAIDAAAGSAFCMRVRLLRPLHRARYYRRVFGTRQAAKLYGAMALRRPRITLRTDGAREPLVCRPSDADPIVLCNTFDALDAALPDEVEPEFIVDAGAHVGYVSVFYANRYPKAQIIAIEPDARNFAIARQNCAPYPQIELVRAGLWSHDTKLQVRDPSFGRWQSWGRHTTEAPDGEVDGISVPTLLERIGRDRIDVLKIDVEGAELALFSADYMAWLPRVEVMTIETHGDESARAVLEAVQRAGLEQVGAGHRSIFVRPRTVS
jgi:FkbM family methyltransferase